MRHADQEADAEITRGFDEAPSGLLLEHVVDDLDARHLRTRAHRLVAMLGTADGWPERCAICPDLPLVAQSLELGEEVIAENCIHARIVKLVDVDVLRLQSLQ